MKFKHCYVYKAENHLWYIMSNVTHHVYGPFHTEGDANREAYYINMAASRRERVDVC